MHFPRGAAAMDMKHQLYSIILLIYIGTHPLPVHRGQVCEGSSVFACNHSCTPRPDTGAGGRGERMAGEKDGRQRKNISPGMKVRVVQKKDQKSGNLTEGTVKEILTNSSFHPHGIKVRLADGTVGRVGDIL